MFGTRVLLPALLVTACLPLAALPAAGEGDSYTNPAHDLAGSHPFVLSADDGHLMYTSSVGSLATLPVWTPSTFGQWELAGDAVRTTDLPAWVNPAAPLRGPHVEVVPPPPLPTSVPGTAPAQDAERKLYLLYVGARHLDGRGCIALLSSSSPLGAADGEPFTAVGNDPLVCDATRGDAVDPSVTRLPDAAGTSRPLLTWVYEQGPQPDAIVAHPLDESLTGLDASVEATTLLVADDNTQTDPGGEHSWEDGMLHSPVLHDAGGSTTLFFSGGVRDAWRSSINYALCTTQLVCTRAVGPWAYFDRHEGARSVALAGPSLFTDAGGALWMAYHAADSSDRAAIVRPRIDKVCFTPEGRPRSTTGSTVAQSVDRSSSCDADVRLPGEAWPEADRMFHDKYGFESEYKWIGSDGLVNIDLENGRSLWAFGDTGLSKQAPWVAWTEGFRFIQGSSVALQVGSNPETATFTPFWKTSTSGDPAPYFPSVGACPDAATYRWFWPEHGVVVGQGTSKRLVVFLGEIGTPSGSPCGLTYEGTGVRAVVIDDFDDPGKEDRADLWTQVATDLGNETAFGCRIPSGPVAEEADGYVYSWASAVAPTSGSTSCTPAGYLTRWKVEDLLSGPGGDFTRREYWDGSAFKQASEYPAGTKPANVFAPTVDMSVHQEADGTYRMVYSQLAFWFAAIGHRSAPRKEGRWSAEQIIYNPPERLWYDGWAGDWEKNAYAYAAKAHPHLTGAQLVGVYYAAGDQQVMDDPRNIAYPRFVKLQPTLLPRVP